MNKEEQELWQEFRESGMLWFANRILHTFGWAIQYLVEKDGTILAVKPFRCTYRGFSQESEKRGFTKVTRYMLNNAPNLMSDILPGDWTYNINDVQTLNIDPEIPADADITL